MAVTVRDVLRLALPPGTSIVAGSVGMTHQVTWVATLRATLPAFADLRGGELVLLSVAAAQALDPRLTLANLVRRLVHAPVSAVAVVGNVTSEDVTAAETSRLPLLKLPDDVDQREVQREVERLIMDYEAQLERRGDKLFHLLTQHSLNGMGIADMLELMADRTNQSVGFFAPNGELRVHHGQGSGLLALQALRPNGEGEQSMLNQHIWVEKIGTDDYPNGYLAIAGTALDEWDRLAVRQGAAALAIELSKEQAVQAAEERLRGDFLSAIFTGPPADPATVIQRGQELGYDLTAPHISLLMHIEHANSATLGRLISGVQHELMRRSIAAPMLRRESGVLCMLPITNGGTPRLRDLAEAMRERLHTDYPGVTLALGTPANSLIEWTRTLKEAEQAIMLGRQLFGSERVLAFSDLGVYRLLVLLRETPELWSFYNETLSPLVAYDRKQSGESRQGGELLRTLDAYFSHLGNLRATSEALHVHRNTLLYRLERIKQISGLDLSDSEEHFALWLALRAHRVLCTLQEA
ncbi:MAG: PucR family transcriptional regulator [Chloroflexaceae bacterium]|nr:PucR family transcriptional regulator [Chloroflexaceae bacterium]